MSDLRGELKEWERAFRARHNRDPTKDDIRQQPAIAGKYKEYARLKTGKLKATDKAGSSQKASSSRPPPGAAEASQVFKTPTKPRPARPRPRPTEPTSSTDGADPAGSPSQRPSRGEGSKQADRSSGPSYVLANSPSKLRALAAAHSSFGSPNRPMTGAWAGATLAPSESVTLSPQKRAPNPFASPQKGAFGEFERMEREKLKARRRAEKERARVLGGKATTQGAGWGAACGASDPAMRAFSRTASSSTMDIDEVDDFFSSQSSTAPTPSQGSQRLLAQLHKASPNRPDLAATDNDGDEVFGPSPIKRASNSAFPNGLSPHSAPKRIFKPLVPESPPQLRPGVAPTPTTIKPKPFASSLPSASAISAPPTSRKRLPAAGERDDVFDAALDDADDDFYADALHTAEATRSGVAAANARRGKGIDSTAGVRGKGRAAPAKRKKTAASGDATNAQTKGKGKVGQSSADSETGMDRESGDDEPEVRVISASRARGELVLDVSREEALGGGRERLVIHEKGHEARVRALQREERRRRAEEKAAQASQARDGDGEDPEVGLSLDVRDGASEEDEEEEEDLIGEAASLFHRRDRLRRGSLRPPSPLSASTEFAPASGTNGVEELGASLPADLAAVLSLRASPQKSHSTAVAKQRQVARLLGEPLHRVHQRRREQGLLGLDEGDDEEDRPGDEAERELEGDDDWDEEPDGWKATGDAMDGYYSADDW